MNTNWICRECRYRDHAACKGTIAGDTCACSCNRSRSKHKYPGSWEADWTPAGARWWEYVLSGAVAVVAYPIALVVSLFRRR